MSASVPHTTLTISIDLEPNDISAGLSEQRALGEAAARLVELFSRLELPATWAVADPAHSAIRQRLQAVRPQHELAILGDASWVGAAAGKNRFGRELSRRVSQARAQGLSVATLALRIALPLEHGELAVKESIAAVRQPLAGAGTAKRALEKLRFGLVGFTAARSLPGTSRWLPGGGGMRAARYAIDRAITERQPVHLAIDAPSIAARGSSAIRIVERVLEHAARRRERRVLDVLTVAGLTARLSQENHAQPSRSILRPAA